MNWKGKQTLFVHLTAASAWIKRPSNYTRSVYLKNKYLLSFFFGIAFEQPNSMAKHSINEFENLHLCKLASHKKKHLKLHCSEKLFHCYPSTANPFWMWAQACRATEHFRGKKKKKNVATYLKVLLYMQNQLFMVPTFNVIHTRNSLGMFLGSFWPKIYQKKHEQLD